LNTCKHHVTSVEKRRSKVQNYGDGVISEPFCCMLATSALASNSSPEILALLTIQ